LSRQRAGLGRGSAVAVTLGVILLGEPLTIGVSVGFALVIAGSVLATRRSQGQWR
jgi:drug/metabolite transporter (DMT)-like permease